MGIRPFAQINCSILGSQKLKKCDYPTKWAYFCTLCSKVGNYMGVFKYPLAMWADDACMSADALRREISRLEGLDLIQCDDDEEIVRIIGFHRQRTPENARHMISIMRDFRNEVLEGPTCKTIWSSAIAEFVVACFQRKQRWKTDSPEHALLVKEVEPFLHTVWDELGETFLEALASEMVEAGVAVQRELKGTFHVLNAPRSPSSKDGFHDGSDIPF